MQMHFIAGIGTKQPYFLRIAMLLTEKHNIAKYRKEAEGEVV